MTREVAGSVKSETVSVAAFLSRSRVNGPGLRSVLWVQGCPMRCEGCFNRDFQEFDGRNRHAPEEIARWMLGEPGTEGVTFSGGEPFAQTEGLAAVARMVRKAGKGVVIFTGYSRGDLSSNESADWETLLDHADMVIAGPYEQGNPAFRPLLSSANQEILHLTDRYRDYAAGPGGKRAEFRISLTGDTVLTGLPGPSLLRITDAMGGRYEIP